MREEHWRQLRSVYESAVPAADVRFSHHWRDVSVGAEWPSVLRVVRSVDVPEVSDGPLKPLRFFLAYNGRAAMAYPLGLLGAVVGVAFRAVSTKEMMSFVRYPDSACFTPSRCYADGRDSFRYGTTVVLTEGFADAEAVARFYPHVVATMGGPLKFALVPLFRRFVRRVLLMMDNDDPGRNASKLISRRLEKHGVVVESLRYPEEYNDPADFYLADPDEMRRRMEVALGC